MHESENSKTPAINPEAKPGHQLFTGGEFGLLTALSTIFVPVLMTLYQSRNLDLPHKKSRLAFLVLIWSVIVALLSWMAFEYDLKSPLISQILLSAVASYFWGKWRKEWEASAIDQKIEPSSRLSVFLGSIGILVIFFGYGGISKILKPVTCNYGETSKCISVGQDNANDENFVNQVESECRNHNEASCFMATNAELTLGNLEKAESFASELCTAKWPEGCILSAAVAIRLQNVSSAIFYSVKGCEYDQPKACEAVNAMKEKLSQDLNQLTDSCTNGNVKDCKYAGDSLYAFSDFSKALPFYTLGCRSKDGPSCGNIGKILKKDKDKSRAKPFFQKGCELKDAESCYGLVGSLCVDNKADQAFETLKALASTVKLQKSKILEDKDLECLKKNPEFERFLQTLIP